MIRDKREGEPIDDLVTENDRLRALLDETLVLLRELATREEIAFKRALPKTEDLIARVEAALWQDKPLPWPAFVEGPAAAAPVEGQQTP